MPAKSPGNAATPAGVEISTGVMVSLTPSLASTGVPCESVNEGDSRLTDAPSLPVMVTEEKFSTVCGVALGIITTSRLTL